MKIKIQSIADRGNLQKERIVMVVQELTDIGRFAMLDAGYSDGGVNTYTRDVFWFPDKRVSAGDYVVLYTKSGKENEKFLKSGKKSHFFYWGRDGSKWDGNDMAPVLLHVDQWVSFDPT
jgi:hypothetical protein